MLNINELERQWKSYRRRVLRPYLLSGAAVVLIVAAALLFIDLSAPQPKSSAPSQAATPALPLQAKGEAATKPLQATSTAPEKAPSVDLEVPPAAEQTLVPSDQASKTTSQNPPASAPKRQQAEHPGTNTKLQPAPSPMELQPSFEFIKNLNSASADHDQKRNAPRKKRENSQPKKAREEKAADSERQSGGHAVAITSTSTDDKIQSLAKRFAQSKNPALGIVIARLYFDKEAYGLSYKYALEVNAIDETNTQSWLIAAKSLYFLQKKEDAEHLLETYIQKTHSSNAQRLLNQIRNGNVQ